MFHSNRISVIVLDYNKPEITNICLESIWKYNRVNIILVNSGKADIGNYTKDVPFHYIKNERGRRFSIGMNMGIAKACSGNSEFIVLLNNDAVVDEGSLELLEKALVLNENLGMVSSNRSLSTGTIIRGRKHFQNDAKQERVLPEIKITENLTGFCLCARTNALKNVNGYDEQFIFGKEDDDLCIRIKRLGFSLAEVVNSSVHHSPSGSTDFHNPLSVGFLIIGSAAGNSLLFRKREISIVKFFEGISKDVFTTFANSIIISH
ncbi:MAG: glycosyltransferase, partial [Thermoplasmatales archaeon]